MKTLNIKKISTLISMLLLFINLTAQRIDSLAMKKATCDRIMNMYKYVFEGKVISSIQNVKIRTGADSYNKDNSYLVQVQKVIKGDIKPGTIELIGWADPNTYHDNGEIDIMITSDMPSGEYIPPGEGIYVSYNNKNIKDSNNANSNSKSLEFDGAIPLSKGELLNGPSDLSPYFTKLSDFYDYLRANYGVKIEE